MTRQAAIEVAQRYFDEMPTRLSGFEPISYDTVESKVAPSARVKCLASIMEF